MTRDSATSALHDIGAKMAKGSALMIVFKMIARSIGLVSTLILARLLTPTDFGLMAMAMSVVALTELVGAFGFDTAIIQRQHVDRAHFDTAWTFNVISAIAIALLIMALTIPASEFYEEPRLRTIMPLLAAGALVSGFENIGVVNFRKDLDFRTEFRFLLTKQLGAFLVTIPMAIAFRSYWALVAGVLAGKAFSVYASYRFHPYRPRLSLATRGDLFHFSKWLFMSNVAVFVQNRSSDFILGRTIGAHQLGIYNIAFEIAAMPSTEVIAPLNRAVFPAYSRLIHDTPQLHERFLEVFGMIALLAFPVCVGLGAVAEPAVLVVLGSQWESAIPLLRLFTIAGLAGALQSNLYLVIIASGRPKAATLVTATTAALSLPVLILASLRLGAVGAAFAYLTFALAGLIAINVIFLRITQVPPRVYAARLWRPAIAAIAMAIVILAVDATTRLGNPIPRLLLLIAVGAASYVAGVFVLWRLSGRPESAEQAVLRFLSARRWRLQSHGSPNR